MHVGSGSEDCWLFVKVENGISAIEKSGNTTIAKQLADNGWTAVSGAANVYAYASVAKGGDNIPVFSSFTIDSAANVSAYASAKLKITGYAVQAEGFSTAAAAWTVVGT